MSTTGAQGGARDLLTKCRLWLRCCCSTTLLLLLQQTCSETWYASWNSSNMPKLGYAASHAAEGNGFYDKRLHTKSTPNSVRSLCKSSSPLVQVALECQRLGRSMGVAYRIVARHRSLELQQQATTYLTHIRLWSLFAHIPIFHPASSRPTCTKPPIGMSSVSMKTLLSPYTSSWRRR